MSFWTDDSFCGINPDDTLTNPSPSWLDIHLSPCLLISSDMPFSLVSKFTSSINLELFSRLDKQWIFPCSSWCYNFHYSLRDFHVVYALFDMETLLHKALNFLIAEKSQTSGS